MKKYIHLILFIFLLTNSTIVHAQLPPGQYSSINKKAIKYIEEARNAYEVKKDDVAEKAFKKALEEDANFVEAALGLANLYQVNNRPEDAIVYFKKALTINPKFFANTYYFLALAQL